MNFKVIFTCIVIFSYSCDDKCGQDIKLGELELADVTKEFLPYAGDETLVFEDQAGNKHTLRSKEGRKIEDFRLIVNTLCRGNIEKVSLDDQQIYYQIQREQIAFEDLSGNQVYYVELTTGFEQASQIDSLALYDMLSVYPLMEGNALGNINIMTLERLNTVSSSHKQGFLNHSTFIGDTTLFGRDFKEVYESNPWEGRITYYNRTKGVIALITDENKYWVLSD
ncbi:MAG: hypothetical protein ACNS62_16075 [Candidatus Cyclobacteriaceae bacterium M3_2C_046]